MNLSRFGLNRRPFRSTPALNLYVPLPVHDASLSALRTAFESGDGVALLDGRDGVGKSLLGLRFLEQLPDVVPVYVPSAHFTRPADLYQAVLFDLGRPYTQLTDSELRLAVTDVVLANVSAKKRTVIGLDECHLLNAELHDELRHLDNLDAAGSKAVFVLLIGGPTLRDQVGRGALASRLAYRTRVEPLSRADLETLIVRQIEMCGGNPDKLFTPDGLRLLTTHCDGLPRMANRLAAAALRIADAAGQTVIDVEVVYEVLTESGVEIQDTDSPAQATYAPGAARSIGQETSEHREDREPAGGKLPKQKARNRRAA